MGISLVDNEMEFCPCLLDIYVFSFCKITTYVLSLSPSIITDPRGCLLQMRKLRLPEVRQPGSCSSHCPGLTAGAQPLSGRDKWAGLAWAG